MPSTSVPGDAPSSSHGGEPHQRPSGRDHVHGGQKGHGGKKRRKQEEEEEEEELPPGTFIRDVLTGAQGQFHAIHPGAAASSSPAELPPSTVPLPALSWARQHLLPGSVGGPSCEDPELGLNGSQVSAIAQAMQHRVALLQGPPGTGKTTTIVRFIKLMTEFGFRLPILACAQSNVAVDNLLEVTVWCGYAWVKLIRQKRCSVWPLPAMSSLLSLCVPL